MLIVLKQILFARSVEEIIRVFVELVAMCVSGVVNQFIELESILKWVHRVSIIIPELCPITRHSRVPLLVPPVGNTQIGSMYFSPEKIRKVLMMWSLVCCKFTIYMFMLC